MDVGLVIDMVVAAAMATMYGAVARAVAQRDVSGDAKFANMAYVTFWGGLAGLTLMGLVNQLVTWGWGWSLPAFLAYTQLNLLILVYALTGLLYYLVFLYTGRRSTWIPLSVFYLLFWVAIIYAVAWGGPAGLEVDGGATEIEYARDIESVWWVQVLGLLLLVPAILAAFAYASLYFKVTAPLQRFRIATVSGSILVWFLLSLTASLAGVGDHTWWLVVSRLLGLGAAAANLVAYRPPAWILKRLQGRPIEE